MRTQTHTKKADRRKHANRLNRHGSFGVRQTAHVTQVNLAYPSSFCWPEHDEVLEIRYTRQPQGTTEQLIMLGIFPLLVGSALLQTGLRNSFFSTARLFQCLGIL